MLVKLVDWEPVEKLTCGRIIAGWHGRSMVAGSYFRNRGYWVIISLSKDGNIQNQVFSLLGFQVIRGSTGRGGVRALAESIRVLRGGATMCLTPDGPRGPSGVVQDGILLMAKKSGCAIVPVGISAKPRFHVRSWDRYMVPWPFSRAVMIFGEPIFVAETATDEELEDCRKHVEREIHRLQSMADGIRR
jgi:hypothetical protein